MNFSYKFISALLWEFIYEEFYEFNMNSYTTRNMHFSIDFL